MSDRPTSCPHCGSKPSSVFWNVFECETSVNKRGDKITRTSLCREREAHNNTKRERDEARQKICRLEKQIEGSNNYANERFEEIQRVRRERDEARQKIKRQAERIRILEGATNHAGGLNK